MKVLLLTKDNEPGHRAVALLEQTGWDVCVVMGDRHVPLPGQVATWEGDVIVSFLSDWVLPGALLARARIEAVNFHPGSPEYPGTGCYNFALYEGSPLYGATCHRMDARVDAGAILAVRRFPVLPTDGVASLRERTLEALMELLEVWIQARHSGKGLQPCGDVWRRPPTTRRDLEALRVIHLGMEPGEAKRRIRALDYPGFPGACLVVEGHRYGLIEEG